MKRLAVIGIFVMAFGVVCESAAQVTAISARDYFNNVQNMDNVVSQKTRRVVSRAEKLDGGMVVETQTNITERLLPDRERTYHKLEGATGITESEQITIGFIQYTRKDGGPWETVDLRKRGGYGNGSGRGTGDVSVCSQYTVESTFADGVPMQLYQYITLRESDLRLAFNEVRTWIGENKLPHRVERASGFFIPREEKTRSTITYEYDPADLKIEAPVK